MVIYLFLMWDACVSYKGHFQIFRMPVVYTLVENATNPLKCRWHVSSLITVIFLYFSIKTVKFLVNYFLLDAVMITPHIIALLYVYCFGRTYVYSVFLKLCVSLVNVIAGLVTNTSLFFCWTVHFWNVSTTTSFAFASLRLSILRV